MADSVEVSTIETTDGTIGVIRDNAARQSIANLREGKETVGSVAWENVKGRPTKVSELENDKKYQTDENVSNTLNSTLYAGSSTHGGPATSADKLTTARTISLGGAAAGSGSFDGSANSTINVSSLDATKLTGVVSITNLPPSVVERMSIVKDDTERLALTKDKVQDGDVVKVQSSGLIYYVVDDDKLNEESGYEVFKAGTAASVPWGGVTDKPSSYPPSSHTHTKDQVGLGNVANIDQSKAIKSITRSGTTFTATALDGTTSTFTQQDTNTTYGVATSSADGLMSKSDKAKLDGIDPSAITTNAANIKKNADAISVRASLIPTGKAIYAGDDLNNISYTAVGTYYCSAIDEAQHISNLPEATAFMMTVYNPLGTLTEPLTTPWQYRVQEFMPYYGTNKYIRMVSTNGESNVTFTDWVKQTYSNDLDAVSNTINTHIANKSNPHGVTKAQVGLGNVDNTADKDKSVKYATSAGSAGSADTVDGFHEYSFLRYRDNTVTEGTDTLWSQIGIREYDNARPEGITDGYNWGSAVSLPGNDSRFDLWYHHQTSSNGDGLRYRTGWQYDKKAWATILDSLNYNKFSPTKTGTGASGTWGINVTGSAGSVPWGGVTGKPSSYPPSSHTHNSIGQIDTRNTNQTPNWYLSNYPRSIVNEFKLNSSIGLQISPTYSDLVTIVPWGDPSGGNVVQLVVDYSTNTLYIRSGTGDTWGSWKSTGGSKSAKYTLTASNWSGSSAPYTYDLGSTYGSNAIIGFDSETGTEEQLEAASAANIQGSSSTKIYAYGEKPTVDIPIVIIYQ